MYHVVKINENSVIFEDWSTCKSYLDMVDNPNIRSFDVKEDAVRWTYNDLQPDLSTSTPSCGEKYTVSIDPSEETSINTTKPRLRRSAINNKVATSSNEKRVPLRRLPQSTLDDGYYAVAPGHTTGIYRTYNSARTAANECYGANVRYVSSKDDAERWIRDTCKGATPCNCVKIVYYS